jgi:hypothetical protein
MACISASFGNTEAESMVNQAFSAIVIAYMAVRGNIAKWSRLITTEKCTKYSYTAKYI